eukprot:11208571-Lingulodinium_polyedra.AAC.1
MRSAWCYTRGWQARGKLHNQNASSATSCVPRNCNAEVARDKCAQRGVKRVFSIIASQKLHAAVRVFEVRPA